MPSDPADAALDIPGLCLVVLIGVPDDLRADFARRHFAPEEVKTSLEAAAERLTRGLLTVLDAPHLRAADRAGAAKLARDQNVQAVALVLDPPLALSDMQTRQEVADLHRELGGHDSPGLRVEGFHTAHRLRSRAELNSAHLRRVPLKPDRRELHGPFDLIGDVHGCLPELLELLSGLGYSGLGYTVSGALHVTPPAGRTLIFLGDLGDRGPDTPGVLRLVIGMVQAGTALCVQGNHDAKLLRALQGHPVRATHGLEVSLEQLSYEPPEFTDAVQDFLTALPHHLLLDDGRLVAAHAGLPAHLQGRDSGRVWSFALYGDVAWQGQGENGLPLRKDWAATYHGPALVAYGHTPVQQPRWKNRTVNLDTGCVFGGQLSALRYPELTTVSVPAGAVYREAGRALMEVGPEERGA